MTNYKGTVIGVEHIQELIEFGKENIRKHHQQLLDNGKIIFVNSDGRIGYEKYGPYKVIHVGAAMEQMIDELIQQLDFNGRMFVPLKQGQIQRIIIIDKDIFGKIKYEAVLNVEYSMLTDIDTQLNRKK